MRNKNLYSAVAVVMSFLFIVTIAFANESIEFNYKISNKSKMFLDGTSTLHDFQCQAEKINGNITTSGDIFSDSFSKLKSVNITIPVKNITNEDEDLTENMHEAFNVEDFPTITYKLNQASINRIDENSLGAKSKGKLTISGVTKNVDLDVKFVKSGKSIKVIGSTKVKMTDFGIDPPTMFLGTIRTGDEITINFELILVKG